MAELIDDVKVVVSPTVPPVVVEAKDGAGDDKDKNFAALRLKKESLERENEELKQKEAQRLEAEEAKRNLGDDSGDKDKKSEIPKAIFDRDMREAIRLWNKKTKVTADEWAQIKTKVSLNGDETVSEIQDKIDEAHQSIPSVRQKLDKDLIEKGKKIAMSEFQDDELDLGSGGDANTGESLTPVNSREKKFLSSFGVTQDEQKQIDKDGNPTDWKLGKTATRKFFQS